MVEIDGFWELIKLRLTTETNSPLKPTKVSLFFIRPNSTSRAEDLAAVNYVKQAVVRIGSKSPRLSLKPRIKDLLLKPKL